MPQSIKISIFCTNQGSGISRPAFLQSDHLPETDLSTQCLCSETALPREEMSSK